MANLFIIIRGQITFESPRFFFLLRDIRFEKDVHATFSHKYIYIYIRDPKDAMPFYFPRRNGNPPLSTMTVLIGRRWWRSITVIIQRVRHGAINRVRRVRNPTIR